MPPRTYSLSNLIGSYRVISQFVFLIPLTTPFPLQSRRLFSSVIIAYIRFYFMYDSFPLCFQTPEDIPCD